MTGLSAIFVVSFSFVMKQAFTKIRPIFRERGKINAEVTGRLTESLGGVRVVKGYHAEAREAEVFARASSGCWITCTLIPHRDDRDESFGHGV